MSSKHEARMHAGKKGKRRGGIKRERPKRKGIVEEGRRGDGRQGRAYL